MRFISIRKRYVRHWFVVVLVALVVGTAVPHSVFAQTGQEGGGSVWGWVTNGFNTVVNNGVGFFVELGNQLGWPNSSGPTAISDATSNATNGIINTGVDVIVATGNQLWWPNSSGPTVISNIVDAVFVNPIVDLIVNLYNNDPDNTYLGEPAGGNAVGGDGPVPLTPQGSPAGGSTYNGAVIPSGQTVTLPNGQHLTLTQGQTATINPNGSVTIHLTNGHTAVITSEGYVTEYNSQGEPVASNDPAVNPGNWDGNAGNSNGPSIPGASVGTVGNPFSDGTDNTDAASNNDEISPFANPYLFEYDPNSTNNNPSGGGAQTQ